MKYATAGGFRTALETRLLAQSRQTGVSLLRLRRAVVFDRLMARLLVVARARWVLKGALALDFRLGDKTRVTKDLDLARHDDEAAATADFVAAQVVDLADHFAFVVERTDKLDVVLEGAAVRYQVTSRLDGRTFENVIVDVGFGDPLGWQPDLLRGSDLLAFAGIDPIVVPVVPLEQHIAEKLHAYTRGYAGGRPSTREKDLVDLVLIQAAAAFEAGRLRAALDGTFRARGAHTLPTKLPSPPPTWGLAYRKMAIEVGIDPNVSAGFVVVAAFLDPILGGAASDDARWDPVRRAW